MDRTEQKQVESVKADTAVTEKGNTRSIRGNASSVAKVSHTLSISLADRLEEFAFRQRLSESAVIEFALQEFFAQGKDDELGDRLRTSGAGRRRRL